MENINELLNRQDIESNMKKLLYDFGRDCNVPSYKKGFYIYGAPGTGKTEFVLKILKDCGYDVIKYDAGDVRNKSLIDTITSDNISSKNVLDMMNGKTTKLAILMDEIDGMNSGDKGGITALIKLIRQKKTKKQKLEHVTANPIICIGNYYLDKKMKELMKVCNIFELKTPTDKQIGELINKNIKTLKPNMIKMILKYVQGDLRKLQFIKKIIEIDSNNINEKLLNTILQTKCYNEDSKKITKQLINNYVHFNDHNNFMNETDRTIVALLWHENIIDLLNKHDTTSTLPVYLKILDNICFSDYIDRITFQHQIWQFNEMSSMNKTFHNNYIYHNAFPQNENKFKPQEVRFTKVLTKYSTEYNNQQFILNMCQKMEMDASDLLSYFIELRFINGKEYWESVEILENLSFSDIGVTKLDIKRMYRYIDKNESSDDSASPLE